jgi:D-psicose/D-tagatose/L-ribulose 3-epimerase
VRGEITRSRPRSVSKAAGAAGLVIAGTTVDLLWPRDRADLCHPDRDVRADGVRYYQRLVDLVVEWGCPAVGMVPATEGRTVPVTSWRKEWNLAVQSVRKVSEYAAGRGVRIGVEPLNRYETYLVNRIDQALELLDLVDVEGTGVIADTFHMNLEEADPAAAVRAAGLHLMELQIADSNRLGLGRGHLDVKAVLRVARDLRYDGPFVLEFVPPGSNAATPRDGSEAWRILDRDIVRSTAFIRGFFDEAAEQAPGE